MKTELRKKMLQRRMELSPQRRKEAQNNVCTSFSHSQLTLSYASFGHELDIWELNHALAKQGKLALPKVEGDNLQIYHVEDCEKQLVKSMWGFFEPNPQLCEKAKLSEIALVLVPGLAFDQANHRLGYGKGYYDRFLKINHHLKAIGVGFREQLFHDLLPIDEHDVSLSSIHLG